MAYYHTAQICINGHMINDSADRDVECNKNYCDQCGGKTISKCPSCNSNIHGDYEVPGVCCVGFETSVPAYCHNCGQPYPWTKQKLEAVQELLTLDDSLNEKDLQYFSDNMNSIVNDTPKTKVVATKLKMFLSKAAPVVGTSLRELLVDIASEAAKKIIFP